MSFEVFAGRRSLASKTSRCPFAFITTALHCVVRAVDGLMLARLARRLQHGLNHEQDSISNSTRTSPCFFFYNSAPCSARCARQFRRGQVRCSTSRGRRVCFERPRSPLSRRPATGFPGLSPQPSFSRRVGSGDLDRRDQWTGFVPGSVQLEDMDLPNPRQPGKGAPDSRGPLSSSFRAEGLRSRGARSGFGLVLPEWELGGPPASLGL